MGARQSKRSVDITTSPKKGEGEAVVVGEEKIEKLADTDVKAVVTNGTAVHTDIEFADKDEESKETDEKPAVEIKENGLPETSDGEKTPDKEVLSPVTEEQVKTEEIITEKSPENGEKVAAETPDTKKQKEKKKKKWSLRSISFSKKDKSKPSKEKEKNGEVEELNEEKAEEVASPTNETAKTEDVKTPTEDTTPAVTNGNASKEELAVKVPETIAETEVEKVQTPEKPVAVEVPKEEIKAEPIEAPVKVEECAKISTEETKTVEEVKAASPVTEEVKEVRKEEVPPPLPSSNPPSQVTVFAESTKDNLLSTEPITINEKLEVAPVHELPSAPIENEPVPETKPIPSVEPNTVSSPVVQTPEVLELTPPVEKETALPSPPPSPVESVQPVEEMKLEQNVEKKELSPPVSPIDLTPVQQTESNPKVDEKELLPNDQSLPSPPPSPVEIKSAEPVKPDENVEMKEQLSNEKSTPVIVEALSKQPEDLKKEISESSVVPSEKEESSSSNLVPNNSDTSNLNAVESNESSQTASEQISTDTTISSPSMPMVMDEKSPMISSAGDVPYPSNENLTEINRIPPVETPSLTSEPTSELSTVLEVDSKESKLDDNLDSLSKLSVDSELLACPVETLNPESISQETISKVSIESELMTTPVEISNSEPISQETIPVVPQKDSNTDSLPDLSTESLPSLPEPTDSMLEPMSLPPLDSVPEPLVDDTLPTSPVKIESPIPKPIETELPAVLTNGKTTNGLKSSPTADDDETPSLPPLDGPLKQIIAPEPVIGDACENSQISGDTTTTESPEAVPATDE